MRNNGSFRLLGGFISSSKYGGTYRNEQVWELLVYFLLLSSYLLCKSLENSVRACLLNGFKTVFIPCWVIIIIWTA